MPRRMYSVCGIHEGRVPVKRCEYCAAHRLEERALGREQSDAYARHLRRSAGAKKSVATQRAKGNGAASIDRSNRAAIEQHRRWDREDAALRERAR